MPPRWLPALLRRVRNLAEAGRVRFTLKALRELAGLGLGLDQDDACDILARLTAGDFSERLLSEQTGEWMYIFKPVVAATRIYVKVIVRRDCIVISMHEDEVSDEEDE